jgi:hypothetical protein
MARSLKKVKKQKQCIFLEKEYKNNRVLQRFCKKNHVLQVF